MGKYGEIWENMGIYGKIWEAVMESNGPGRWQDSAIKGCKTQTEMSSNLKAGISVAVSNGLSPAA